MQGHSTIPGYIRRIIQRFAMIVCPPELRSQHLLPALEDEFTLHISALPASMHHSMLFGYILFDQLARFYPPARLRRFVQLDDLRAEQYYIAMAGSPLPVLRIMTKLLKGLLTMHYYELPAVKLQLQYDPEAYIAYVTGRRRETYRDAILAGEAAILQTKGDRDEMEQKW